MENRKARINASLLPSHQGQQVVLLGSAHDPSSDGSSFQLTTSDSQNVTVKMSQAIEGYVEGLVEVQGVVDQQNNIQCDSYVTFSQESADKFDMASYDRAVQLIHQHPAHYINGVGPHES